MMLSFTVRVPSVNGFSTTLLCAALTLILCSCGSEPVRQEVSGTVETDQVRVASRYGGRVKAVLAAEGEALAPGRVIVELEAAELGARLDQARAQNQIQTLQMAMIFILPSVFFSGFIFPRETMPKIFQMFGALLPATYYIELQRAIVLRGASLADFWSHLVVLTIMGVAVFSLCALRLKQRVS